MCKRAVNNSSQLKNSMGIVHRSQGGLTPISPDLASEVAIICGLAKATLRAKTPVLPWDT